MGTNTYVALDKKTVTTAVGSVVFTSIPSGYTDLRLVVSARGTTTAYIAPAIAFNTDTSSTNYSWTAMFGDGGSGISYRVSNQNVISGEQVPRSSDPAGMFGVVTFDIQNYSNATTNKTVLVRNSSSGANGVVYTGVGLWRATPAAINTITVTSGTPNFEVGSTFSLYGIAAASVGAKATGGIIYSDANYYYHAFTSTGTFTPLQSLSADLLVVAGGGAGGSEIGGGGGAGGILAFTSQSLTATGYTCTVGAGGAQSSGSINGASGTNSQFGALTASIGGGGGTYFGVTTGISGGSGGGGGRISTGGAGTSGQGNAGARGWVRGNGEGGGGGGGGAAGNESSTANVGGIGGTGLTSNFINALGAATGAGVLYSGNYYFAGGGGGGNEAGSARAAGGVGGGGSGGYGAGGTNYGNPATVNTGGGGGGGQGTSTARGGAGGSGIVIVRYAK